MRFMFLGPCGPSCGPDDDFEDRETIRKKMSAKRMRCSEILGTSHATNPNPKQLPNNKVLGCSSSQSLERADLGPEQLRHNETPLTNSGKQVLLQPKAPLRSYISRSKVLQNT